MALAGCVRVLASVSRAAGLLCTLFVVLGQLIKLTPVERDSIIHILKRLHDEQDEHGDHSR